MVTTPTPRGPALATTLGMVISARTISRLSRSAPRATSTVTALPTCPRRWDVASAGVIPSVASPSTRTNRSPTRMPARSAGLFG